MKDKTTDERRMMKLSENRFRSLVLASSELICRMSADWQQMYTLSGKDFLEDTKQLDVNWLELYIPEADRPQVWAAIRGAIANKKIFELEHRVMEADGNIGWTFSRAIPMLDETGQIEEWIGASSDITKRKRREHHQEFLLKLNDVLWTIADPVAIQQTAMQLLGEQLDVNRAFYGDMQPDEDILLIGPGYAKDLFPVEGQVVFSEFDSKLIKYYSEGQTVIINDLYQEVELSEQARADFDSIKVRAVVGVPLLKQGKVQAILSLHQSAPRRWKPEEIELLQKTAERTWAAVERAKAEEALRQSEEKYRMLFETMGQGYAELEIIRGSDGRATDIRYLELNPKYERQTGIPVARALGRTVLDMFPDLDNWWIQEYDRIVRSGCPGIVQNEVNSSGRWYEAKIYPQAGERFSVLSEEITVRKKAEVTLRESEERQSFLLKLSDKLSISDNLKDVQTTITNSLHKHYDAGWCYYVEWDEEKNSGIVLYDSKRDDLLSLAGTHDVSNIPEFLHILKSGQILNVGDYQDYELLSPRIRERYIAAGFRSMLVASLVKQGRLISSLLIGDTKIRDWSHNDETLLADVAERTWAAVEKAKAEEALRESEKRFQSIANLVPDLLWESEPDGSTNWYNQRWLEYTGQRLEQATGWGWTKFIYPDDREASAKRYAETVDAGKPLQQEHRIRKSDGEYRWFVVSTSPVTNENGKVVKVYGAANDIHERKQTEEFLRETELQYRARLEREVKDRTVELHQSRALLRATLDSNVEMIQVFKAVRDDQGKITDFVWLLNNRASEEIYGDVIGQSLLEKNPGVVTIGIFDSFVSVTETGIPQQYEKHYVHEQFDDWYYQSVVKMDDGITTTTVNITARKQAEEERFKNYTLLQQSEDIAPLGSWDYNLLTGTFTWSDGMYRLFDLEQGKEIQPEIYLEYTTENCREAAQRIVDHIRRGDTDFEETLELNFSGNVKVLHIKAAVITNEEGHAARVLGIDIDISATRAAEEKIHRMEAEQRLEIFRISLSTLEEERQRIAESLHNGIGQILYGVKLSLAHLNPDIDAAEFRQAKTYTSKLLTDVIVETRRISHELMPTTLEQFGLKSAIDDVCEQFSTGIKITCKVTGIKERLEKYLELAVYRTTQELMTNIIKHANATEARINIAVSRKDINITVSDNGQGITAGGNSRPGIGLASIRSKIGLLNGKITISSGPEKGTTISIFIPVASRQPDFKIS